MTTRPLGPLLYSFFEDYLKVQKGLRPASLSSYRDTLRLFLAFVAADTGRRLTRIELSTLTAEQVVWLRAVLDSGGSGPAARGGKPDTLVEWVRGR